MLNEAEYIADQIQRSWRGPAWHGPSLQELIRDVNNDVAERRPGSGVHSIREIVQHVTSWQKAVLGAVNGTPMPNDNWSEDWPERAVSWTSACEQLGYVVEMLVNAIRAMPVGQLSGAVPGREYDYRFLLSGVPQHNSYHGGQIALLKKS